MRRLVFYTHLSLDGFFSGPNGELDNFVPSDEVHQHANDYLRDADAMLFGRVMYDVMSYWDGFDLADQTAPRVAREFAEIYQSKPRYVMSRSQPQLTQSRRSSPATSSESRGRRRSRPWRRP